MAGVCRVETPCSLEEDKVQESGSSDLLLFYFEKRPCSCHLYQVGSRHPPLLKVLLPVLLLHLQGKARPQDSLRVGDRVKDV